MTRIIITYFFAFALQFGLAECREPKEIVHAYFESIKSNDMEGLIELYSNKEMARFHEAVLPLLTAKSEYYDGYKIFFKAIEPRDELIKADPRHFLKAFLSANNVAPGNVNPGGLALNRGAELVILGEVYEAKERCHVLVKASGDASGHKAETFEVHSLELIDGEWRLLLPNAFWKPIWSQRLLMGIDKFPEK